LCVDHAQQEEERLQDGIEWRLLGRSRWFCWLSAPNTVDNQLLRKQLMPIVGLAGWLDRNSELRALRQP